MNNPPAFPFPAYTYPNGEINHGESGMTLRDYFAAKALPAVYEQVCRGITGGGFARIANLSYDIADAMLKAREA
jgi:hypothetical protein